MDKIELLQKVSLSRVEFEAMIAQFSNEQMLLPILPGNWTVKDVLAHIASWARHTRQVIEAVIDGQEPVYLFDESNLNATNQQIYEENHLLSLADVRSQEAESYQALLALIEHLSSDDLDNSSKFAWMKGSPLNVLVEWNTFGHYEEHMPDLRRVLVE